MRKLKEKRGITLIALVVTIIVLIILAGISIGAISGEKGIINNAKVARDETNRAKEEEQIDIAILELEQTNEDVTMKDVIEKLKKEGIITNDSQIGEDGTITSNSGKEYKEKLKDYLGSKDIEDENNPKNEETDITKIEEGQYVAYDPTILDLKGTKVNKNLLTYTSPIGTVPTTEENIITHGNGSSEQKFTAKSNTELKWKVLNKSKEKIELISEIPVKTDANNGFTLSGAIGYLYAEQELNEICKIYGYGYGADTAQVTEYTVGGPFDTPIKGKIEDSGARSIKIEDINKLAGIEETEESYKELHSNYGNVYYQGETAYPKLNSTNTEYLGMSTDKKGNIKHTFYRYDMFKISDENIRNMIFNDNYWIASRCIENYNEYVGFAIHSTRMEVIGTHPTEVSISASTRVYPNKIEQGKGSIYIRPIVTLKTNVIDTNKEYDEQTGWNLK